MILIRDLAKAFALIAAGLITATGILLGEAGNRGTRDGGAQGFLGEAAFQVRFNTDGIKAGLSFPVELASR